MNSRRQRRFAGLEKAEAEEGAQRAAVEPLFVLGLSCTLFQNDEVAEIIEEGQHLLPAQGDNENLVDRWDARLLLEDVSVFDQDFDGHGDEDLGQEERAVLQEERWKDLDPALEWQLERLPHQQPAAAGLLQAEGRCLKGGAAGMQLLWLERMQEAEAQMAHLHGAPCCNQL